MARPSPLRLGKMFVGPVFDYFLIGGLLSWAAGAILFWGGFNFPDNDPYLWWAILVSNWAHFAASSVRLYTRPDAVKTRPFLTVAFPVIAVAAVTAALVVGEPAGRYLFALYLVWSPYHYSRQAYGLSVMYAYRSGCALEPADKRLFNYFNAFVWATVFHGLQYLVIVSVFHVRDQERLASNSHGWFFHTATFYVTCLVLGWVLFFRWPQAYWLLGFGIVPSGLLVTATINIHHFVVDAFIWRLRRDPNYQIVVDARLPTAAV